jgi:predicted RecA/RadA family phage recombinase
MSTPRNLSKLAENTNSSGVLGIASGGTGGTTTTAAKTALGLHEVASTGSYTDLDNKPTTTQITEGTNLYFTDARVRAAISASGSLSYNSSTGVLSYTTPSTTGITEGTNLYYTDSRARAAFSAGTGMSYNSSTGVITTTITQYTDALARAAVSAGTGLSYNSSTGVFTNTITQYTDSLARAAVSASGSLSYNSTTGVFSYTTPTTSGIAEGTNLYYTDARAISANTSAIATAKSEAISTAATDATAKANAAQAAAIAAVTNGAGAAFDTLKEIQDAMATDQELAAAIAGLTIGNATQTISTGTGLSGGGSFTANQTSPSTVTLGLATAGTAGTYTKVTTDAYGRVTSGTTLSSGDIPSLSGLYLPLTGGTLTGGLIINAGGGYPIQATSNQRYQIGIKNTSASAQTQGWWFAHDTGGNLVVHADSNGDKVSIASSGFGLQVGVASTYDNPGGWNANVVASGTHHARVRVKGTSHNSSGDNEAYLWVDNTLGGHRTGLYSSTNFNINVPNLYESGSRVLNSSNYNNYSPTLTGGNASGTWNINITGSAGSAGSVDYNNLTNKAGGTGTYTTSGDYRAPIFYDSNDTTYYLDPNSTTAALLAGSIGVGTTSPVNSAWGTASSTKQITVYGSAYGVVNIRGDSTTATHYSMGVGDGRFYAAYDNVAAIHRLVFFGSFTGLNYGSSPAYNLHLGGTGLATDDWRAPIFYDSNDTSYYVNPNGDSRLSGLSVGRGPGGSNAGNLYIQGNHNWRWIAGFAPDYGVGNGFGLYSDTNSAYYLSLSTAGNWWFGVNDHSSSYRVSINGTGYASSDLRAPIFYDSNDTSWYVDPHTNSRLNQLGVGSNNTGYTFYNNGTSYLNGAVTIDDTAAFTAGNQLQFYTSAGSLRGYINVTDTDDNHFQIATSGGEDIVFKDSGLSGTRNLVIRGSNAGTEAYGSMRSPIFYDSNDTGFYVDPNSTSRLNGVSVYTSGSWGFVNAARGSYYGYSSSYGTVIYGATSGSITPCFNVDPINNPSGSFNGNGGEVMFRNGVQFISPNSSNNGYNNYFVLQDGYAAANNSFRAPIFYDSNNTGYYVDPNGNSALTTAIFYVNGSSEITLTSAGTNASMIKAGSGDELYIGGNNTWQMRFSGANVLMDNGGYLLNGESIRAPIFYDTNNTAYYIDPAATVSGSFAGFVGIGGNYGSDDGGWAARLNVGGTPHARLDVRAAGDGIITTMYSHNGQNRGFVGTMSNHRLALAVNGSEVQSILSSYSESIGSYRAPIFYDSNDTAYYTDPNNTSRTADIHTNRIGIGQGVNASWPLIVSGNAYLNANGYGQAEGSWRAPIFYDSSDTGYYDDPNGTGNISSLNIRGTLRLFSSEALQIIAPNQARQRADSRDESSASRTHWYGLLTDGNTSNFRHAWYDGSAYFNVTASGGEVSFNRVGGGGYVSSNESLRAPIFYDLNNTSYYCNPDNISVLWGLTLAGGSYFRPQNWIQMDGSYGIYWPNHYGAHLYPNAGSTYTQLQIDGSKNSYSGMYISHSAVNGMMYDGGGNGGVYREAQGRWYFYHHVGNNCMGVGTSSTSSAFGIYVVKGGYFDGRVDATIHYDASDTGYYLDPNSTTALRTVGSWRADSASWDGEFSGKIQYHSSNWYFQYAGSMLFRNSGGSNVFTVDQSGNAVASGNVTAYSDARLKENVVTIDSALDKVLKLRGVYYNKIGNPERRVGVIAQETETVLPEVVRSVSDTNPSTGETQELLAVDYGNITGLLIEAIKEQDTEITDLRNCVAELKALINKLIKE